MNRIKLLLLMAAVFIVFSHSPSLYGDEENAEEKNWEIRNYQTARIDTRGDEEDGTYLTRGSFSLYHTFSDEFDVKFEVQPFAEARYLWDREEWRRTELGVEAGFHLTRWAYIGEGFHYAWLKGAEDTPELETRLVMSVPVVLNSDGYELTLELIEEYTYALEPGKGTRNEIAANLIVPVFEHLELLCGWCHTDRISDYDSDQVELSAIFTF